MQLLWALNHLLQTRTRNFIYTKIYFACHACVEMLNAIMSQSEKWVRDVSLQ